MPKRLDITLSNSQRTELLEEPDHHPKAYVREKAAAILKLAEDHLPAVEVAAHRLLKRRDDNTVRSWLRRYLQGGLADLLVQRGRGRKPAFSPQHDAESAAHEVQEVLHRSPLLYGLDRHSWTLKDLGHTIGWMHTLSIPAVCKLLQRFKLVYKRGQAHVHSPDLEYNHCNYRSTRTVNPPHVAEQARSGRRITVRLWGV